MDQTTDCTIQPIQTKFRNLKNYSKKVNWVTFVLLSLFCISSWVSANSVWSELPFYIIESPEGWRLTSVLTVLAQIAQILPMTVFLLLRKLFPKQITYRKSIYFKVVFEVIACTLLGFFWNKTIVFAGEEISIGLYIISFIMSLLCGLSSLTFLPYIGEHFAKQYIVPLYIGESVSSSIPSLIVFFQGSSDHETSCHKSRTIQTNNDDILTVEKKQYFVHQKLNTSQIKQVVSETFKTEPNFSVSMFFFIITGLMFICSIAFVYVDIVYARKKTLKEEIMLKSETRQKEKEAFIEDDSTVENTSRIENKNYTEKSTLLVISFFIACFMYGILPGIQPYSTLPYGYESFNLSINLGNLLLPIAVFSSIFSKKDSMKSVVTQFLIGISFSLYLLFISIMSPCPPFVTSYPVVGSFLAVFAWILIECIFIRLRCKIAERFERFGGEYFLALGFVTLLGQVMGGTIIYICIDIYRLFHDKPQCVPEFSYCM